MSKQSQSISVTLDEGAEFVIGGQEYVVSDGQPVLKALSDSQAHANEVRERSYRLVVSELGIDITLGYWDIDPEYHLWGKELDDIPGHIRATIEGEYKGSVLKWALDWGLLDELDMNLDSDDVFIQELAEDGSTISESGGSDDE